MANFDNNEQIADVMIHVDENIDANEKKHIIDELNKIDGVVPPQFNTPHLIVVNYNPQKTCSYDLLTTVKAEGLHAQLIGI